MIGPKEIITKSKISVSEIDWPLRWGPLPVHMSGMSTLGGSRCQFPECIHSAQFLTAGFTVSQDLLREVTPAGLRQQLLRDS